ncbi:Capping protein Arp2/3 and myosin-I linker protein 2 [Taenia crassiceps]|uniref:Capping protein Arp2/3 and myosin-I linker protein 2 n=1 Tax=Taenia crassiceps TaxID=6207 RepID=A0ABR4QC83_9CEST
MFALKVFIEPENMIISVYMYMLKGANYSTSSGDAILVEGDDTLQLLASEKTCGNPDINIQERFACKEHKILRFPDFVSNFSDDSSNYAICPLLSAPFFTVLDLGDLKMGKDFISLCSVGLRTNKAIRSLVFRDSQIDSVRLGSLLRSLPNSSKLRKLDIVSKDVELSKVFGDLKPTIYQQLIDLSVGPRKIDNDTFMKTITHIKPTSSEKLPLRRIVLSNTCIPFPALKVLTSMTPQLRELVLNRCDLDVSVVCIALNFSSCTLLENLSLAENKFITFDAAIKDYFASLRFLQRLSLKGTTGENASNVMKMLFKGLRKVENPVYNQLSLDLGDCKLDAKAAEVIAKCMPKVGQLKKVLLDQNAFGDKITDIIKCLPKCPRLEHIALGHRERSMESGVLKKLAEKISLPECKVNKLTLSQLGSNKELCEFLRFIVTRGKRLAYLDISDYTLEDDDSKYILGLIQWVDSNDPFILICNRCFNTSTRTDLKRLAKQKGLLINQCEKNITVLKQPESDVKGLMEVEKFNNAIVTPSPELCDADLELTRLAIRLQSKMPTNNVEKLEPHYTKIHQAKIALREYSKLPSMHVELLNAALDPEECNLAVDRAMNDVEAALQRALQSFQDESCQRLKDIVYHKALQSLASITKFSPQITESYLEPLHRLLSQVESSIRSMLLDTSVKVAEEMLCRVTNSLRDDIETCLNGFPDRVELKPSKSVNIAEKEPAFSPRRSYTMSGIVGEYGVENALYASDTPFTGLKSAPPRNERECAAVVWASKKESSSSELSGSPVNEYNPVCDQEFSEIQMPVVRARPIRQKTHTVTTIIHTADSEVVHGPVDAVDLFPTSNPPPKEAGEASSDDQYDVEPPSPMKSPFRSPLTKPAIPGMNNDAIVDTIRNKYFSLQKPPQPPLQPSVPYDPAASMDDAPGTVAQLKQRFENNSSNI